MRLVIRLWGTQMIDLIGKYWLVIIVIFLSLFFGKIAYNGIKHSEYRVFFTESCKKKGGIVDERRTGRGWSTFKCVPAGSFIDID